MTELLRRNLIPLIVATALFMENMDATVLATSLPAIAKDLSVNPINLKLALTTYLLALAVFIPASGWMADRVGAKNVFRAAMVVFAIGSIACARLACAKLVNSGITSPRVLLEPIRSERAECEGWKLFSRAVASTRSCVAAEIRYCSARPLSTMLAVVRDSPARRAMSSMVSRV